MKINSCLVTVLILISFILMNINGYTDESKIGFINVREIIQNSDAGKKAGEEFKKLFARKREEIAVTEKDLKKLKDELDKQGPIMNENARREKETAYQKKIRDYQLLVEDTNKELKLRDREVSGKMIPHITKVVSKVAEKEKYTLVIDIANMPVLYYARERDFSNKVIEEFNKLPSIEM